MSFLLLLAGGGPPPALEGTSVAGGAITILGEWCPSRGPLEDVGDAEWAAFAGRMREDSEVSTFIGRSDEVSQFQAGHLRGVLVDEIDPDDPQTPLYDVDNPSSPYAGNLKPLRQTRWRAQINWDQLGVDPTDGAQIYDLWRGYLRGFPKGESVDDRVRTVPIDADDAIGLLGQQELFRNIFTFGIPGRNLLGYSRLAPAPGGVLPEHLSGDRIDLLLDSAGWPEDLRSIDAGRTPMSDTMPSGRTWGAIVDTEQAEDGFAFVDQAGKVTFRDRTAPWFDDRLRIVQHTFSDQDDAVGFTGLNVDHGLEYVRNVVARTAEDGVPRVARDQASIDDFFEREDARSIATDDYLFAQALSDNVLYRSKDVHSRIPSLEIRPLRKPEVWFPVVLGLRLLDRVAVERLGVTTEWWVQGIGHRFSFSDWTTTLLLTPTRTDEVFVFNDPERNLLDLTPLAY